MELVREAIQPVLATGAAKAKEELQELVLAVKLAGSKEIADEGSENTKTTSKLAG